MKSRTHKARLRRYALEALEPRTLLAVLPPPVVTTRSDISQAAGWESSPSVAVSPNDPLKAISVWTQVDPAGNINLQGAYSVDGGSTWTALALPGAVADPTSSPIPGQGTPLPEVTDASVAFDRNDQAYIVTDQHTDDLTVGAIILMKVDFSGATPRVLDPNSPGKVLYGWTDDAALHPIVAVDNTAPRYTDPVSGTTVVNPYSGNIYVAWTTNDTATDQLNPSVNSIKVIASSDGGSTFTSRRNVSDDTVLSLMTAPRITVSQGTPDGRIGPGQTTLIWDDFGSGAASAPPLDLIKSDHFTGAVGQTFTTQGVIADATTSGPKVTNFPITVNIQDPRFLKISDISVRLALTHTDVSDLQIDLVSPDGRVMPLVAAGDASGTSIGIGGDGVAFGATFDQQSALTLAAATAPYAGLYQAPRMEPADLTKNFILSDFYNLSSGAVRGTWYIRVTDNTNGDFDPTDPPRLIEGSLIFTSGLNTGTDRLVSESTVNGALLAPYPLAGILLPNVDVGAGPAPVIAADNTVSSASGFQGRIYAAYVDRFNELLTPAAAALPNPPENTDIFLTYSDDGGVTWKPAFQNPGALLNDDINSNNDGFTEGFVDPNSFITGRPQFLPSLAVDPSTGTLAATFYDARYDAARSRVAMTLTTSINGGQSFSPQNYSFVNTPNAPVDQTQSGGQQQIIGPIPDNLSPGMPDPLHEPIFGFGDRQGLAFQNGQIIVAWSGNENGGPAGTNLLDIHGARAVTAAGPRIISSTMGPVQAITVDNVTFNDLKATDGTPLIDGFVVQFDRPVDTRTFGINDVQVYHHAPNQPSGVNGDVINVASIQPLDAFGFRATTFLVHLVAKAKWATGTYSYAVGADIRDFNGQPVTVLNTSGPAQTYTTGMSGQFSATELPLSIPAGGSASTTIHVDDQRPDEVIESLEVTASVNAANSGTLALYLDGPGGITVPLALHRGTGVADAYQSTTFSDTAATSIGAATAPFAGSYKPETPLAALAGQLIDGDYTLRVVNTGGQAASITGYSIKLRTAATHGNTLLALPDTGRSLAVVDVVDQPTAAVIKAVRVQVGITHPKSSDLKLTLIAPDGTRILLASGLGGATANAYQSTTFDDTAAPIVSASAPFNGSFAPQSPLAALAGKPVNGSYRLEVVDTQSGSVGTINNFSLSFDTATSSNLTTGAIPDLGVFTARTDLTGAFAPGATISDLSVTVSITHPRPSDLRLTLVAPDGTQVPLALNRGGSTANAYQGTIFTDSAIKSIATATPPFVGTYKPEMPLSALLGKNPSGLWSLQVTDTVSGKTGTLDNAVLTIGTRTLAGGEETLNLPDKGRVVSTLAVQPMGTIAGATVTVSLNHPDVKDLSLYLVAPDGTRVTLVDQNPASGANYTNTTFDDSAATAITAGMAPYTGRFQPQQSLNGVLAGKQAGGLWRLEIVDRKGDSLAGVLKNWSLAIQNNVTAASTDVGRPIPDNNPTGLSSSLGVFSLPAGTLVNGLKVTLSVTHPADQELSAVLIAPDGTTQIQLFNAGNATGGNFTNTTFADSGVALSTKSAPYDSTTTTPPTYFLPAQPLSTFNGLNATGIWTLKLVDSNGATPANVGTLNAWSLTFLTSTNYGDPPADLVDQSVTVATLDVTDFPTSSVVDGVDATVSVQRNNIGDLALYLVSPDGTRVPLSVNNGGNGSNYTNTTFSDLASTPIGSASAPFTGTFRPDGTLTDFNGKSGAAVNGVWRLEVVNTSSGTPGMITGFQLKLRAASNYGKVPLPIPDQSQSIASLSVSGFAANEVITDVDVTLSVDHPATDELQLILVAPDGTQVPLVDGVPATTPPPALNFTDTTFDDQATYSIIQPMTPPMTAALPPFTGRFQPVSPLSALNGKQPNGTWKLIARDTVSGNVGIVTDWSLNIRTAPRFTSTSTPVPIPDLGQGQATVTVATPSAADTIAKVTVNVSIDHPKDSDLVLTLIAPDGAQVLLSNQRGGTGAGYTNTVFDDDATTAVTAGTAPFTGMFRSEVPLSFLNGHNPNGTWTLRVTDKAGQNIGQITNFSVIVQTVTRAGDLPLPIYDFRQTVSTVLVDNVAPNALVRNVKVHVDIQHPHDADLTLYLVAPDGARILLSRQNGGKNGSDYTGTVFDDQAAQAITGASAPFTGSFQPQESLFKLLGLPASGNWSLVIVDSATPDGQTLTEGTLLGWSLELQTATQATSAGGGNPMDQNANGALGTLTGDTNEALRDTYSAPTSNSNVPFLFPYDPLTLPLIVVGPHIVSSHVPGSPVTVDNLVTDQAVSAIDVTFDRTMNGATFGSNDVLRIDGPLGPISGPFTVNQIDARTFRIGFPAQTLSGTYTIQLGADILSADGDAVDNNLNAGLDSLRGVLDPTTGATVTITQNAQAPQVPLGIAANTTVVSTIDLTNIEDFLIQDLNVKLDITFPNDPALTAKLVAVDPGGDPSKDITVALFSGVGNTGDRSNFQNTVFDDEATTLIQDGGPPFFGRFKPQATNFLTLGQLKGKSAARIYRLEITNSSGQTGMLNSWSLEFLKPVPSTGLGEPVADRTPVSFRIFTMSLTDPQSSTGWTAVGPASSGAKQPGTNGEVSGRIGAIAVDPSDPSGNTVYVSGASGGVWKTTNFLTTDPAGPTYVPLTDFGPAFGMRISGITVVGRNNDPNQSIIFALTGDGEALGDPARPADLTSRGVGILRSMDGGQTWTVLDSSDNSLPLTQRDHVFSGGNGTAGFKIVADPKLTPTGEAIVYAALSDIGPDGNDTYNEILTAAGLPIRGGLWRSVDSGKHWQQMKAGQATDVVLDPLSGTGAPGGNLQFLYAAFRNDGVYFSPNRGQVLSPLPGVTGTPLIQNADFAQPQAVPAVGPPPPQFAGTQGSNRITPNSYITNSAGNAVTPAPAEPSLGRIVLAKPSLTGDTLRDQIYQGWIYAVLPIHNEGDLVQFPPPLNPPSSLFGLFLSKDFGQTWTQVHLPQFAGNIPTNDETTGSPLGFFFGEYDVTGSGSPGGSYYFKGNFDLSLAVDPTNPAVVYLGGTDMFQSSGLLRIDTTALGDPHAFFLSNDDPDGGLRRTYANRAAPAGAPLAINATHSNLNLLSPGRGVTPDPNALDPIAQPQLNLIRDPKNPFKVNATILVRNALRFNNTGDDAKWQPFDVALKPDPFNNDPNDTWSLPTRGVHRIITLTDPLTGHARLIIGDDQGIYTAVDQGDGTLVGSIGGVVDPSTNAGNVTVVNGSRNGNLQIAQFLSGAVQPSLLSAQLATLKGMIYGNGTDAGQPHSDPNIVTPGATGYGNVSWVGPTRESGNGVATEQSYFTDPMTGLPTARGLAYHFETPEGLVERDFVGDRFHPSTDFFQVNGVSRTFGLLQFSGGGDVPDPQWPFRQAFPFAVNPINGDQAVISSAAGRIFGTETQGNVWSVIGQPQALDGTIAGALAYGAPDPNGPGGVGNLGSFIYAGTDGGNIFVTQTGGGGTGNQWTGTSDPLLGIRVNAQGQGQVVRHGLDGSPVTRIITNPTRGSHEAYAVTAGGRGFAQQDDQTQNNTGQVPDGGTKDTVVTVSNDFGAFRIATLQVTVTVTQSGNNVAPLDLFLVGPDGTTVRLTPVGGGRGTSYTNTTFDDSSLTPIQNGGGPNTAIFKPAESLDAAFYNKELRGAWRLRVVDRNGGDTQTANITSVILSATSLGGVFHNANTIDTNSHWEPVTGNLFALQSTPFGTGSPEPAVRGLTSLVADWRYVVPDDPANPNGPTHPILYTGGNGGVFRSTDNGLSWLPFPATDPGSLATPVPDGGALPNAQITDLDLSLGIIDPTTGQPNPGAQLVGGPGVGPNILVASSYGRGSFAIRLAPQVFAQTLRFDDALPDPPGAGLGGSDTGNANTTVGFSDKITRLTQPIIDGNSQQSAFGNVITVNLLDLTPLTPGGPLRDPLTAPIIGTGQTDAAGRFSIQIIAGYFKSDGTTDGLKTVGVRGVDQAGSQGNVALFQFTLDTTPPAKPAAPDLQDTSDTGLSNTDNITRITNPVFDVQVIENLAAVVLFRDGVQVNRLVDVSPDTNGVVAIQDPGTASDGVHLYTVQQYDVAGNPSAISQGLAVTINTTPPPDPTTPDLEAIDDTPLVGAPGYVAGVTDTDNITAKNTNLHFDVGNVESNATLELLRDGNTVNTITVNSGGTVTIVDPTVVTDGSHSYKVRETDLAGNVVLISGALQVVIDTVAPGMPSAPDLEDRSDSGVSNTDNITMDRNPFFQVASAEATATLQLLRKPKGAPDTAYVVASSRTGPGELQDSSNLLDGDYTYATRQIDVAGNVSPLSATLDVTIDTIALTPPGPPDLEALSDTPFPGDVGYRAGITDTDNITRVTLFHFPIFDVAGENNATIYLVRKNVTTGVTVTVGQRTGPGAISDPGPLPDQQYDYTSYQADLAGNVSGMSPPLRVTIDTQSPTAPSAPDLQAGSDNGVSSTDNITSAISPYFDVTGVEAGATLILLRDGVTKNTLYNVAGGTITIQDPGPVPGGTHSYTLFQADAAGNLSPIGGRLDVTIDTTAPSAPSKPDLIDASDSGTSNSDNITSVTTPTFNIAQAEVIGLVELLRRKAGTNDAYVVVGSNPGPGQIIDNSSGPLADGMYEYVARQTDQAGNTGALSASLIVTIDTTASTLAAPVLDSASDTGTVGDNKTRATQPIIDLAPSDISSMKVETGARVELYRDGGMTPVASGIDATSLTDPGPITAGQHTYTVRQIDRAGNASAMSPPLTVTFIFTAPSAPSAPDLEATSDSGVSNTDNLTKITTPTFDITTFVPGATVELLRDGISVASVVTNNMTSSPLKLTDPNTGGSLSDGQHKYTTRQTDVVGNVSAVSAALTVTIDTIAPVAPGKPVLIAADDTGSSSTDGITNKNSNLHFDISSFNVGATVELLRDGMVVAPQTNAQGQKIQLEDMSNLADGTYGYTTRQTDQAGNVGPESSPTTITVQTMAPVAPSAPVLSPSKDSGRSNSDGITSNRSLSFTIATSLNGATVQLLRKPANTPNAPYTVVASATSTGAQLTLSDPTSLSDGQYVYAAQQVSASGGTSPSSSSITVTIDTVAPSAIAPALANDNGRPGDNTTTDRQPVISGTTDKGAQVDLLDIGGNVLASAIVNSTDGSFTVTVPTPLMNGVPTPLRNGQYVYRLRATDAAGNIGAIGSALTVTLASINGDYDDDGKADLALYTPFGANWAVLQSKTGIGQPYVYGAPKNLDIPVTGDFDGDGKADIATYRPSTGQWSLLQSSDGSKAVSQTNLVPQAGDIPVPADYDGDGKTDLAIFRPSTAEWFITLSSGGVVYKPFGAPNQDIPVPADYDGDGKADIATYRPAKALWSLDQSTAGPKPVFYGAPSLDVPVPADYDGDGKTDVATWRPTTAQWSLLQSTAGSQGRVQGAPGDVPVPADYDGDGKADLATYRTSTAFWSVAQSSAGPRNLFFGTPSAYVPGGAVPVLAPYSYRSHSGGIQISGSSSGSGSGFTAGLNSVAATASIAQPPASTSASPSTGQAAFDLGSQAHRFATGSPFGRLAARRSAVQASRLRVRDLIRSIIQHDLAEHAQSQQANDPHDLPFAEALARLGHTRRGRFFSDLQD